MRRNLFNTSDASLRSHTPPRTVPSECFTQLQTRASFNAKPHHKRAGPGHKAPSNDCELFVSFASAQRLSLTIMELDLFILKKKREKEKRILYFVESIFTVDNRSRYRTNNQVMYHQLLVPSDLLTQVDFSLLDFGQSA